MMIWITLIGTIFAFWLVLAGVKVRYTPFNETVQRIINCMKELTDEEKLEVIKWMEETYNQTADDRLIVDAVRYELQRMEEEEYDTE